MNEQFFVNIHATGALMLKKIHPKWDEKDIRFNLFHNIINFPLKEQCHDVLEVKKSSIHGNGVFAKYDIDKDKVVCVYPIHGMLEADGAGGAQKHYSLHKKTIPTHFNIADFKFDIGKEWGKKYIYGDPKIHDYFSLGHLINDACKNPNNFKNKNIGKSILRYLMETSHNKNCSFMRSDYFIYVKTIKKISKGEELLAAYGFPYWFEKDPNELINIYIKYMASLTTNMQKIGRKLLNEGLSAARALKPHPHHAKLEKALAEISVSDLRGAFPMFGGNF